MIKFVSTTGALQYWFDTFEDMMIDFDNSFEGREIIDRFVDDELGPRFLIYVGDSLFGFARTVN